MERLTLACLQHLVTVVIFVTDLSEECGSDLKSQWNIRQTLQSRFRGEHWIDVFSKADVLNDILDKVYFLSLLLSINVG